MCGESVADSLVARGERDTSDNNPDSSAAIWYTPHGRVWECRRAGDTPQIQPVMPREVGASGVLLKYAILPYDNIQKVQEKMAENACHEILPRSLIIPPYLFVGFLS